MKYGIGTGDLLLQTRPAASALRANTVHTAAHSSLPRKAMAMASTHAPIPAKNPHALNKTHALGCMAYRTSAAD